MTEQDNSPSEGELIDQAEYTVQAQLDSLAQEIRQLKKDKKDLLGALKKLYKEIKDHTGYWESDYVEDAIKQHGEKT